MGERPSRSARDLDGRVALVIPTLDGGDRFERALETWRAQTGVGTLELCCPDSGSQDGSLDAIRRAGGRVLPIGAGEFNHGDTRNRAVAATQAEFVILTVQDAVPVDTQVALELVAPLDDDPTLCATYGRQVPLHGCHPVLKERIGNWAGDIEPVVQSLEDTDWESLEPLERLQLVRYDHVIAAMRRSVWEQHRFEPVSFGEDVRWAARVVREGGRIAYLPAAAVEHSHDRSAWDEARRIYCDHRNLRDLVDLVTVPHRKLIRANVEAARAHYQGLVESVEGVDATTRRNWIRWSDELALYECWAQYLGANVSSRWWFAPIDRWLRRGI